MGKETTLAEGLTSVEEGQRVFEEIKENPDVKGKVGVVFLDTRTKLYVVQDASDQEINWLEGFKKVKEKVLKQECTPDPDISTRYQAILIGGFRRHAK